MWTVQSTISIPSVESLSFTQMSLTQQVIPSNTITQKGLEAKVSAWWQTEHNNKQLKPSSILQEVLYLLKSEVHALSQINFNHSLLLFLQFSH